MRIRSVSFDWWEKIVLSKRPNREIVIEHGMHFILRQNSRLEPRYTLRRPDGTVFIIIIISIRVVSAVPLLRM